MNCNYNAQLYPLMLKATYSCCTGKHSFWHADAMAEQRTDYSRLMTIADAVADFAKNQIGQGGKIFLATDPMTARKVTEFFGQRLGKERQVTLEQRIIQFESAVPLPKELPEPDLSTALPKA